MSSIALAILNSKYFLNLSETSNNSNNLFMWINLNIHSYLELSHPATTFIQHIYVVFFSYGIHGAIHSAPSVPSNGLWAHVKLEYSRYLLINWHRLSPCIQILSLSRFVPLNTFFQCYPTSLSTRLGYTFDPQLFLAPSTSNLLSTEVMTETQNFYLTTLLL